MISYSGDRTIDGTAVARNGQPLDPALSVHAFSSLGLDWGCDSPLSRQLALALLVDHFGDAERALACAVAFSRSIVAQLDNEWEINSDDIEAALVALRG